AVDDQRPLRVLRQLDDALHAQELLALHGAQEIEERLDRGERHRPVVRQRYRGDAAVVVMVMVVAVVAMVMMMPVMPMIVMPMLLMRMTVHGLAQPAAHVGGLGPGVVEAAVQQRRGRRPISGPFPGPISGP